jgi:predicted kinase
MPTLHLICGLPGSGKSTLAKQLERELAAVRLTPDEWMSRIGLDGYDERARAAIEAIQWDLTETLLAAGKDVILEAGFWSKDERQRLRQRAAALGANSKIHFLDVSRDELIRRLTVRNAALPDHSFAVNIADLEGWITLFEPPTHDELA